MNIRKGNIPLDSLVYKYLPVDYSDVYTCIAPADKNITPDDIQVSFWTDMPRWVEGLFKLRNLLVKPFGLKSGDERNLRKLEDCIRTGGSFNFVSVSEKSQNETVLCLTDKHLVAYVSVCIGSYEDMEEISMVTLVNFCNKLGYVYFYTIYPFHHIVVKRMLKNTINKLFNNTLS